MAKIQLNTAAPDFTRDDFEGHQISLADYRGQKHLLLVFNRGFL